ncbi:NADH-quinone oxidoreductase subunit J [Ephemeroptericola cinctiostellae]|uniref:NADH-quinone oxidoreductase subunit J n=1 Tax=Ephemeroptericola cinctiostellae TaxID=2268024 RepID=A0A345D7L7_9BURK|nr:NADH-quinone oxidoreductase subunit J [Ephemeroptericola cinctiostellae]AXF84355.1 NADH-quinone oxidoreductase subunit J [Ephemeroptericola cinctiostellae]
MDVQSILYFIFAGILLVSALLVVTVPNPVHSALFLMLSFFSAAGIWIMLQAEFLGILLILVYVGAVMILFLFVVMMINLNLSEPRKGFKALLPWAFGLGTVVVLQMGAVIYHHFNVKPNLDVLKNLMVDGSNTRKIGQVMYTEYAFPFEIAALILLVALIAAVAITLRHRKDAKSQNASAQAQVKSSDRLTMVTVAADMSAHQTNPPTPVVAETAPVAPPMVVAGSQEKK